MSAIMLVSCTKEQMDKFDAHKLTVELTYNNGDKDTIVTVGESTGLYNGDFHSTDGFTTNHIASGVRRYKVIKKESAYDENGRRK